MVVANLSRLFFGTVESKQPLRVKVTLTAAQVKALFTTPITLIAAPGAGIAILVDRITFVSTYGTATYAGSNALEFRYTDASGSKVTADIPSATLNFSSGTKFSTVAGVVTELIPIANSPIVVAIPTANPTVGDSIVYLTVDYSLIAA